MFDRRTSLLLLFALTCAAYLLRVIGTESSVLFAHDVQIVRQSMELGQRLLNLSEYDTQFQTGFKYPLSLSYYLTGVYGLFFVAGRALGLFDSLFAFQSYLFAARETMYTLAVLALNLISVLLVPAIFFAQRAVNKMHAGWLAAGLAAFNLLLVHFAHQPRPHVPFATIGFCAVCLLVMAAYRVGGWPILYMASFVAALTVGALQSGVLIVIPYLLMLALRPWRQGKFYLADLVSVKTLFSIVLFILACLALYPDLVGEYGLVILDLLNGTVTRFTLGSQSHSFSLELFSIANIPQFVSRMQTYSPLLTLLLPFALIYFVAACRRRFLLLLIGLPFPILNLLLWSAFFGTFPRITAVLIPFIIFGAAFLVEDIVVLVSRKSGISLRRLRGLVFLALLLPSAVTSMRFVWVTAQTDTRTLAVDWVNENISNGETILLNFHYSGLLPTNDAIQRQATDFPDSVGAYWQWLQGESDLRAPRYNLYTAGYWRRLDDSAGARERFVERAGIRYLLVRSLVSLKSVEDLVAYAQSQGRLVRTFCPGYNMLVAELPDDLFYEAWRQLWQLERPGPFVAVYDLQQPPEPTGNERFCQTTP